MKTSRNIRWSELRTSILTLVAITLLAFGILQLGGKTGLFSKDYHLVIYLDNSLGLKTGSVVRLAGLDVGNVEDVGFTTDPSLKKVLIKLSINKEYMDRIRKDSVVTIKTMGLLGDKYVDISVGSPTQPVVEPGGRLMEVSEAQFAGVLAGAATGLEGFNVVVGQLKQVMDDLARGEGTAGLLLKDPSLYNELNSSAVSLQAITADLKGGKGTAGKFLNDPKLYDNLNDVSNKAVLLVDKLNKGSLMKMSEDKTFYDNLHAVSVNLKDVSGTAKELVDNLNKGNFSKLSNDKELYAKLDRVSTRLDTVMERLESGQGSAGKLLADEKLYNNINKFFEDADSLVLDLKKDPKKYLKFSIF
ncbi:MAG: MlaD family protein [Methanothrix sp.]|nr:MlaD family protein [Methanothrix sp.]